MLSTRVLWTEFAAVLLVLLGSFGRNAESFALPNAITRSARGGRRDSCGPPALLRLMITSQDADSSTFLNMNSVLQKEGSSKARRKTREISDELISLLQREEGNRKDRQERAKTIRALVQQLVDARVTFEPRVCLNDAILYKSHVVDGPSKPLWEQLGSLFSFREGGNLQGQQYNFDDKTVVNYAEIFGPGE